jgi:AsmA protein
MASLGRLDLRLALLPLLSRHIEIERLDLLHPVITLQIDAQGRDNWHFERAPAAQQSAAPAAPSTARRTTLRIETMSIADGAITFSDARTGASFGVNAVQLTATQSDAGGAFHIDATAADHAVPLAISGDLGRPGEQFMPIDLTLKAADASLTVRGTAPHFAVSGSTPDLSALSPLAGRPLPSLHITSFQADLAPPANGTLAKALVLTGIRIAAPTGDVSGDATITLAAPVAIRAALTIHNLDPAALLAAMPSPAPAAPAASPSQPDIAPQPSAPPAPRWVISDRPLPFDALPRLDADLTLTLQDTRAGEATIKSVDTHALLHAGRLTLDPLGVDGPGGHMDASAMFDASGAAALKLHAPALSIQPLLAALDVPDGVHGTMDVRADLHGTGMTPHALAASLDGNAGLALANGEIDSRLLVWLLSRVAPEAGLLDIADKAPRSALRCVALRADASHGVVDLHALLLDTAPLRLTGSGTFDLSQETLSLRLQPLARIGSSGFSMPVDVRGNFRAPRAAVDATGAGKNLGGIVIGALGADRLIAGAGETDGCAEQLKLARFGDPGPVPAALPAQEAGKPASSNLNNLLKQLLR